MFHVELRRFPHVAREFNLTEAELQARIVAPWVRGGPLELQDRRFTTDRARLTIYEGPAIAAEDRGLGRGWSAVTRDAQDVTARVIEAGGRLVPHAAALKRALLAAPASISLSGVVSLAGDTGRPSERLAAAEQAVWELLHEGRLELVRRDDSAVGAEEWEGLLLAWETWADAGVSVKLREESDA